MSDTTNKKNYALPIAMMFALFAMISFVTGLTAGCNCKESVRCSELDDSVG